MWKTTNNRAEAILSNTIEKGTKDDPLIFTHIDFTSTASDFTVSFHDFVMVSKYDPKTGKNSLTGDPSVYGLTRPGSNTQNAKMEISTRNTVISDQIGAGRLTLADEVNPIGAMARTLAHEIGHTAGLKHVWSSENDILDTRREILLNPSANDDTTKKNLMNSEANTNKPLRSNSGTDLTPGQRSKIKRSVETQQQNN